MNRKAAVELSMNFLVIIILGVVVLSMGIYFAFKTYRDVRDIQVQLDDQTRKYIWNYLDSGDPVVAPLNSAEVERGGNTVFGIGVRNILDQDQFFRVVIDSTVVENDKGVPCDSGTLDLVLTGQEVTESEPTLIKSNEKDIIVIGVSVPKSAKTCDYVLDARVENCIETDLMNCGPTSWSVYNTAQKLYIIVPN